MPHQIFGRGRTTLRDAQQGKSFQAQGVDYGLQVADSSIERHVLNVPVRQPDAPLIEPDEAVVLG